MNSIDLDVVRDYVNENIDSFHQRRIRILQELDLYNLIKKNPYLFKAKAIEKSQDLIEGLLDAYLSSSEEELFGEFLEDLAVFIAEITTGGKKSPAEGVDLEFVHENTHYIVAIKSGPNWGNSQQQNRLEQDLKRAKQVLEQSDRTKNVRSVLGICYGNTRTSHLRGYMKVVGEEFWKLISGSDTLYMDIIEPIGFKAKEHNEQFELEKTRIINKLNREFMIKFCDEDGFILWKRLVFFVSGSQEKENLPYGYYYDYDGIHIHDEEARTVRKIFDIRYDYPEDGKQPSYQRISDILNQEGKRNWVGNEWNSGNIGQILRNEEIYSVGGIVNESDAVPPILD